MSSNKQVLVSQSTLQGIASAIRSKTGTSQAFKPAQMISAVSQLPSQEDIDIPYGIISRAFSSYTDSKLTTIGAGAFYNYTTLNYINCPNVSTIGAQAFRGCGAVSAVFENATNIGWGACSRMGSLTNFSASNIVNIADWGMADDPKLSMVSFPKLSKIGASAFMSCFSLARVNLYGSSVVTLNAANAFYSTPMSKTSYLGYFGSIYVPASLYNTYKNATNWTTYANRFASV